MSKSFFTMCAAFMRYSKVKHVMFDVAAAISLAMDSLVLMFIIHEVRAPIGTGRCAIVEYPMFFLVLAFDFTCVNAWVVTLICAFRTLDESFIVCNYLAADFAEFIMVGEIEVSICHVDVLRLRLA